MSPREGSMDCVGSLCVVQKARSREFSFVVKERVMEKDRVEKAEIWAREKELQGYST